VSAEESLSPATTSKAPERRLVFDVGWDDGLTYEIARSLPALARYDRGLLSEVQLRGRFGGSLYLDGGWLALAGEDDDGLEGAVRRARLYTSGELVRADWPTEYKLQFALEDGSFFLHDFYLRWRPPRWVDTIRVGYFVLPISLASITASADRSMMEVAPPVSAFAPSSRFGIEVTGSRKRPSLAWQLNLASVGQAQPFAEASSDVLRAVGRVVWRPRHDPAPAGELLHLGLSTGFVLTGGGTLRYRARAESILTPYVVDSGDIDGDSAIVALEAAWRRGPLSIQGELLQSFVHAEDEGSLHFHGAYAQASWVLTGESRPYDPERAIWSRLAPARPLAPRRGQWGALELAARISWLDLDDGDVRGGRSFSASIGPVWTWNRFVRVLGGYVYAHPTRNDEGDAHVLQLRLELEL
jgi:phosphate-selective porin OprO/OprP